MLTKDSSQWMFYCSSCDAYHVFISLQSNFEDVSLLCLGQEEEHGLGLMCSRADKNHTSLWVIQVILLRKEEKVTGGIIRQAQM